MIARFLPDEVLQLLIRNFARFSCKKSTLVFMLIKHVSVLGFFFLGACITWHVAWHVPLTLSILMGFHYIIESNFVNTNFLGIAFQWFFSLSNVKISYISHVGYYYECYWQHFVLILPYFSRDCPIFYMRKKVQKDLSDQDKLIQRFGDFTWW